MYIYAEHGHKVFYTGEDGYDHQHKNLQNKGVKVGDVLTVSHTDVGSWNTDVMFLEIPGYHNSVIFEDCEAQQ